MLGILCKKPSEFSGCVCMYAFMYVRRRSSVPTPMKYLDLVGAYVCMYVYMCVCVCNKTKVFVRPHLTDVIGVKEGGHGLSGGGLVSKVLVCLQLY